MKNIIVLLLVAVAFGMQVGGFETCPDDENARAFEVATFAAKEISKEDGLDYSVVDVLDCKMQIVNGINWRLELQLSAEGFSDIKKVVVVFDDIQENSLTLMNSRPTRRVIGGWFPCDLNNGKVFQGISFALKTLNDMSNSAYELVLVNVDDAQCQIVNGFNMRLELTLGGSPDGSTEQKTCEVWTPLNENQDPIFKLL